MRVFLCVFLSGQSNIVVFDLVYICMATPLHRLNSSMKKMAADPKAKGKKLGSIYGCYTTFFLFPCQNLSSHYVVDIGLFNLAPVRNTIKTYNS